MKILGVDTALGACSVAVLDGERVLAHRWTPMVRGHAEALAPMVQEAVEAGGVGFAQLERLAVTTGPGTFTGQRVGLAFMRGLRIALRRPLIGVTTLQAMAAAASAETGLDRVAVLHEAKRGEVYGALFDGERIVLPVQVLAFEAMVAALETVTAPHMVFAGTAAEMAVSRFTGSARLSTIRQPDALWVARLGQRAPKSDEAAKPLYLRSPDAKLAAAAIRLRPASRDDRTLLARLHAATMPLPWEESFFASTLESPGGYAVIAEAHGAAIGFVLGRAVAGEAEILSIGVLAPHRRNAVGKRLLRETAAIALHRGATTLFLEVASENQAARLLYESHGFQAVGQRKGYYRAEGGGDALLLRASLPLSISGLG